MVKDLKSVLEGPGNDLSVKANAIDVEFFAEGERHHFLFLRYQKTKYVVA